MKARATLRGMVTMGTMADGMCQRKTRMMMETTIISSTSLSLTVAMALSMSVERSYTGRTSTPAGREALSSLSLSFTRPMTARAFSPWRITTMPPTTSPWPSRSASPRRISGPRLTVATSESRTGVPPSTLSTALSRSWVVLA